MSSPQVDLSSMSAIQLMNLREEVISELSERGILRTRNHPLGDFTEWLVAEELDLERETNAQRGYDAKSEDGTRYQIKGRQLSSASGSWQVEVRGLSENRFDHLILVVYEPDFEMQEAFSISHEVFEKYARYKNYTNEFVITSSSEIFDDDRINTISKSIVT